MTTRLVIPLVMASMIGVGLYIIGVLRNHSLDYWYLPYNLALGLIPLLLAAWLCSLLRKHKWSDWRLQALTVVWLLFLPNSFYIVTDFVHLPETPRVDLVQDVVMLAQFSFVGMALGFMGLFMVQQELARRLAARWVHLVVAGILLLCSFAIYLGRELRWNSWDVMLHPIALATDITRQVAQPQLYITTVTFFLMLGSVYLVLWRLAKTLSFQRPKG